MSSMAFCSSCGEARVEEQARFCRSCGFEFARWLESVVNPIDVAAGALDAPALPSAPEAAPPVATTESADSGTVLEAQDVWPPDEAADRWPVHSTLPDPVARRPVPGSPPLEPGSSPPPEPDTSPPPRRRDTRIVGPLIVASALAALVAGLAIAGVGPFGRGPDSPTSSPMPTLPIAAAPPTPSVHPDPSAAVEPSSTEVPTPEPTEPPALLALRFEERALGEGNYAWDVAQTGFGGLVVGEAPTGGGVDAAIWRVTGGDITRTDGSSLGGAGDQWLASAVGGPGVAIGFGYASDNAAIWWTSDGSTWERASGSSLGGSGSQRAISGALLADRWIAIGREGPGATADGALWTSLNGTSWSRVRDDTVFGGIGSQHLVAVVGSLRDADAVIVGRSNGMPAAWYSLDGGSWKRATVERGGAIEGRIEDAMATYDGYVAVGRLDDGPGPRPAIWTSTDGASWSLETMLESSGYAKSIAVASDLVVVGGAVDGAAAAWASSNGSPWERLDLGSVATDSRIEGVAEVDGLVMLVGGIAPHDYRTLDAGIVWQETP